MKSSRLLYWKPLLLAVIAIGVTVLGVGYWNATRDPVVRRAELRVAGLTAPLRVLLVSDIHVAGPDMTPGRLSAIVARLNRLEPDVVLIAGDLISEKRLATELYDAEQTVAPLGGFRARLGTYVALGNHDHWFDAPALATQLDRRGITILENRAVDLGLVIVGGLGDELTNHDDVPGLFRAMDRFGPKPRLVVTHGPDAIPDFPAPVTAIFAGHTHCGQIVLPGFGPISYMSRFGRRFGCGQIDDSDQRVFVTAGLGTSVLPVRYGAPPDVWLVTLRPNTAG